MVSRLTESIKKMHASGAAYKHSEGGGENVVGDACKVCYVLCVCVCACVRGAAKAGAGVYASPQARQRNIIVYVC